MRPMPHPRTFRVTEGVYCVMRRSYFTCSYLVVTPGDGVVAVDAGMKSSGRDMLHALREIGRTPKDVSAILLTHWHNDHTAGACELAEASGASVFYHQSEADYLTRRTASHGLKRVLSNVVPETGPFVLFKGLLENAPARGVAATRHVADGDVVAGGFEVVETPGHTAGHVSFFYRPGRVLFAGDALAVIAGKLRFMARPVTEDLDAARRSMLKLLDLPADHVCPGHREPLADRAAPERERMRQYVLSGGKWPLFG